MCYTCFADVPGVDGMSLLHASLRRIAIQRMHHCSLPRRLWVFLIAVCPLLHAPVAMQVYKRTARVQNAGALEQEHERAQRASQSLLSRVSRGGLLAVVPDPVTCFKDSSFRQVGGAHRSVVASNCCKYRLVGMWFLLLVGWVTVEPHPLPSVSRE